MHPRLHAPNLLAAALCLFALPVYAQMGFPRADSAADRATQSNSSGIKAAPTADTLNTLNREAVKTGVPPQTATQAATQAVGAKPRVPSGPAAPTQFQRFVAEATGANLAHFGYDLFDQPANYLPDEGLPVPSTYTLGPGDEVQLQVWGAVDFGVTLVLDRNGRVFIPKVGMVPLQGVAVRDLEPTLRTHLGKVFANINLNANIGRLRSIQIYVMGQARQPGNYVVSSLSTLVSALFLTGGPSAFGTMRRIQLQRDGKTITELDLYDLFTRGDKSKDMALLPGDIIVIPPAGPRVAVSGAFDHPAIYELKDAASNLDDVLKLHGGVPTLTSTRKALLERINPQQSPARQVLDLALDPKGLKQNLRDGDVITLLPLDRVFANAVTLRGNVADPLRYPFRAGMRVSDLIPEPAALIQKEYYTRKNAMVQFESGKFESDKAVTAERVVNEVLNLLEEINWDYAVIERIDAQEVRTRLIPFNLGKAIKNKDPAHDIVLQSGDVITVFGVNDLAVPREKRAQFVRINGEVKVPGFYQLLPGETLPQLLQRAGGPSNDAFLYGAVFTRESTRAQQQANLDKAIRRVEADLNSQIATVQQNTTDSPSGNSLQAQLAGQRLLLARMQSLRSTGRIALEIDPDAPRLPPIRLEDGDSISIPFSPSFISVFGEVFAESSFIHKPSYTAGDYIEKAGLSRDADTDGILVIRADGAIEGSGNKFSLFSNKTLGKRLNPGDTIFVPAVLDRRTAYSRFIDGAKDWTAILYQFGLGAAGFKTLRQ